MLELDACAKLLGARPVQAIEDALLAQVKAKLSNMGSLSAIDLVACYEAIKESAVPDNFKAELQQTLDAAAVEHTNNNASSKITAVAQECNAFEKYLTAADICRLEACSMWEGCNCLASRMKLLGIKGMKESLKKIAVGILLWFHIVHKKQSCPKPAVIYDLCQQLMQELKNCTLDIPQHALSLACYPANPGQLKPSHFQASYGDEKPATHEFQQLAAITKRHVWVRSSAKPLKDCFACHLFLLPNILFFGIMLLWQDISASTASSFVPVATAAQPTCPDMSGNFAVHLMKYVVETTGILKNGSASSQDGKQPPANTAPAAAITADANTGLAEPDKRAEPLPLPISAGDSPTPQEPQTTEQLKKRPKTLEDFENEHMAQLLERDCKKKDVKKAAQPDTKGTKPSKAKAKCKKAMKKPAAAFKQQPSAATKLKLGCTRCRGSCNGCSQCLDPAYPGVRMNREEWKAYAKLHQLK